MCIEANAVAATSEKRASLWRLTVKETGDKALKYISLVRVGAKCERLGGF